MMLVRVMERQWAVTDKERRAEKKKKKKMGDRCDNIHIRDKIHDEYVTNREWGRVEQMGERGKRGLKKRGCARQNNRKC